MISGIGYKLWLQNEQTQAQLAALQVTMNQIRDDTTKNEASALRRDRAMRANVAALAARVQAVQHDVRQKTDDARTAFQVLAREIRSNYDDSDDSSDEESDEDSADGRTQLRSRRSGGCVIQ